MGAKGPQPEAHIHGSANPRGGAPSTTHPGAHVTGCNVSPVARERDERVSVSNTAMATSLTFNMDGSPLLQSEKNEVRTKEYLSSHIQPLVDLIVPLRGPHLRSETSGKPLLLNQDVRIRELSTELQAFVLLAARLGLACAKPTACHLHLLSQFLHSPNAVLVSLFTF